MNYLERITVSEEDKSSGAKVRAAKKAKIDTDRALYDLEIEVSNIEDELEAAKNSENFNFQLITTLTLKLDAAKEATKVAEGLRDELFSNASE